MMLQYLAIKKQYEGYLLFYRLGDFYELFFDDAKTASKELDLTLTGRDCGEGERAPMCGVPFHACDSYIAKLMEKGYKVAICEQTEDPKNCKGIVPREVIRIITPGTVTLNDALQAGENNFLCTLYVGENEAAAAFYDLAENAVYATRLAESQTRSLWMAVIGELAKYAPKELVTNASEDACADVCAFMDARRGTLVSCGQEALFSDRHRALIETQFHRSEQDLGFAPDSDAVQRAVGAMLAYLKETQKTAVLSLREIRLYNDSEFLAIDPSSRSNLELVQTQRGGERRGSLLWVIDRTKTSLGARLLRRWLEQPLTTPRAIAKRQSGVLELYNSLPLMDKVREALSPVQDIERIVSRVVYGTANAKDLYALASSLSFLPAIDEILKHCTGEELCDVHKLLSETALPETVPLCDQILRAVRPDAPFSTREGGFIQHGYSEELDELQSIMNESQQYLAKIEATERELTGIPKLKIGYNRVFGYYFEVSKSYMNKVPERYIRKQTLVNAERFITSELKDMESRILGAKDRAIALEYEIFCALCDEVKAHGTAVQAAASAVARLDALASLAGVALENHYVCPIVDYSDALYIAEGRHPVVEKMSRDFFVPNDADLDCKDKRMAIITGPNMAGKSTYMREVALIVILAQMGSFVPAKDAHIGIVDKIFTRVGAGDDLAMGQSTFMLEMSEVAYILKNATKKSLIIYDEIGRGTSTYDGMSIAKAVAEYTASKKCGAKTLFATHYHELSALEKTVPGVKNFNIAAKKRGDDLIFLRKIVPGSADESYGIEVASLAGVPHEVIARAKETLAELEENRPHSAPTVSAAKEPEDLPLLSPLKDAIIETLKTVQIDTMTPIEALGKLHELSRMAKDL